MHIIKLVFIGIVLFPLSGLQGMARKSSVPIEVECMFADYREINPATIRAEMFTLLRRHINLDCAQSPLQQNKRIATLHAFFDFLVADLYSRLSLELYPQKLLDKLSDKKTSLIITGILEIGKRGILALKQMPTYLVSCGGSYINTLKNQLKETDDHDKYMTLDVQIQSLEQWLKKITSRWDERIDNLNAAYQLFEKEWSPVLSKGK